MQRACLCSALLLFLVSSIAIALAQDNSSADDGPTDAKAQKTYRQAQQYLKDHLEDVALDSFKKADKQDGGHCAACQRKMIKYGIEMSDWKSAETGAEEMLADAKQPRETAIAHYELGIVYWNEATWKHKDDIFARAHDEFSKALEIVPRFTDALFDDGKTLAHLHQDDAATSRFKAFVEIKTDADPRRQRALRYISDPELARARMAPAFAVTTLDGKTISLDDLQGKVVLLDFWATWCGPCREAIPHIRDIAKHFQDEPLVVLSINLDGDQQKWKDFVVKNHMTWLQYGDGGFEGKIAKMFGVNEIPHTFTIDADGVLQDEHIGDASMEGKIKKLLAQARESQRNTAPQSAPQPGH